MIKNLIFYFILNLGCLPTARAELLRFDHYHSQDEINNFLRLEAKQNPKFVWFQNLGHSVQNREISYVIISHGNPRKLPAIYLNGTHHGDEWSSTESILALIDFLVGHHSEAIVAHILDSYALFLQPLVNPDGHAASTREDSFGRDPNRDYAYPGSDPSKVFQVPEIRLVKNLVDQVHFHGAIAFHSGFEEILWPWCYTNLSTGDHNVLAQTSQVVAQSMGFDRFLQSYFDYPTEGEFIDYLYAKDRTLALTFEVSEIKTPPVSSLSGIVSNSIKGTLTYIFALEAKESGNLPRLGFMLPAAHFGKRTRAVGPYLE